VYYEWWFPSEGETEPTGHVNVLHEWSGDIGQKGRISGVTLRVKDDSFTPIERDTDGSRQIAGHLLSRIAFKLKLIDEERLEAFSYKHPLVGIPCYYKGDVALPFGLFKVTFPPDENLGQIEPETRNLLGFFKYERDIFHQPEHITDKPRMVIKVGWENAEEEIALFPMMRESFQAKQAYHDLVSELERTVDAPNLPKPTPSVQASEAADPLSAQGPEFSSSVPT
jgi:hypothetical protein